MVPYPVSMQAALWGGFPVVVVLLGAALLGACADERDAVARVVHRAADAAEAKRLDALMTEVAPDYQDEAGRGRERIRALVGAQLQRPERITIAFRRLRVGEIEDGRASVTLDAVLVEGDLAGRSLADVLPESLGTWRFTLDLRQDRGRWLITGGQERPIPPATMLLGGQQP